MYEEDVLFTSESSLHGLENSKPAYYIVTTYSLTHKEPQNKQNIPNKIAKKKIKF